MRTVRVYVRKGLDDESTVSHVTWNCTHLANAALRHWIDHVCLMKAIPSFSSVPQQNYWRMNMSWQGPIVEEVRQARDAYAKQFSYDLEAICRDLKTKEGQNRQRVVPCPPKRQKAPDAEC